MVFLVEDGACNVTWATGKGAKLQSMLIDAGPKPLLYVPDAPVTLTTTVFNYARLVEPLYYEWDFGDGTLDSGTLPSGLTPDAQGNVLFDVEHAYNGEASGRASILLRDAAGAVARLHLAFDCDGFAGENFDSGPPPPARNVGMIGNGAGMPGNDATVPTGDTVGDPCDRDDDNDGLPDDADSDPRGDVTYDDDGDGNPSAPYGDSAFDDGPSWDADGNSIRDGVMFACEDSSETSDNDGDGLLNSWEVCFWGTDPDAPDSDGDGLGDCLEAVDTNGDAEMNFGDLVSVARASQLPTTTFGKDGDFDIDGNTAINFGDVLATAERVLLSGSCLR
jgi:hypothetical protein